MTQQDGAGSGGGRNGYGPGGMRPAGPAARAYGVGNMEKDCER